MGLPAIPLPGFLTPHHVGSSLPDMGLPWPQEDLPIVFLLFGAGGIPMVVPFNIPAIGIVNPQQITVARVARGTVLQTAKGAFLDDFGEGVAQLLLSGSTGWKHTLLSGIAGLKAIEALFVEYLRRRDRLAQRAQDPNLARLWYLDTLNIEAFEVYPHEFTLEKAQGSSLLYHYRLRFSVFRDLLQDAIYAAVDASPLTGFQSGLGSIGDMIGGSDALGILDAP